MQPDYRDREFNTNTSYTRMAGYIRSIRPDHVRSHAREALKQIKNEDKARYRAAASLTSHVYKKVEYSKEQSLCRADYILDKTGEGDCEDHSTLLASLLVCRSFDVRYVVVEKTDDAPGHVMLEVLFTDVELQELIEEADSYDDREIDFFACEEAEEGYWLLCDTTCSPIVGAAPDFYSRTRRDGRIRWRNNVVRDYLRS